MESEQVRIRVELKGWAGVNMVVSSVHDLLDSTFISSREKDTVRPDTVSILIDIARALCKLDTRETLLSCLFMSLPKNLTT